MSQHLQMKIVSWDKQNYELFDNEANSYQEKFLQIRESGFLVRNNTNNESTFITDLESIRTFATDLNFRILMIVQVVDGVFFIGSNKHFQLFPQHDDLWVVAQNESMNGFQSIKEGDSIKLGKKQFKIIQVVSAKEQRVLMLTPSHYEEYQSVIESQYDSVLSHDDSRQCRICLSQSQCHKNPLISVCKCSGSMKYVHFECLKYWLDGKLALKTLSPFHVEINGKSVRCELCLTFYPPSFVLQDRTYEIYNLGGLILGDHVIMEDEEGKIQIINFMNQQQLLIGRGHESHVKISEITVSRTHVMFQMIQSKLFVKDQGSKFGTLVKLLAQRSIFNGQMLTLQNGRSRIILSQEKEQKFKLFRFCGMCSNQNIKEEFEEQVQEKVQG